MSHLTVWIVRQGVSLVFRKGDRMVELLRKERQRPEIAALLKAHQQSEPVYSTVCKSACISREARDAYLQSTVSCSENE